MEVCVYSGSQHSGFRRQHAGALWLRAIASYYQQQQQQAAEELPVAPREQIVFEAQIVDAKSADVCRGAAQWRSERARVKIKTSAVRQEQDIEDRERSYLILEVWEVEAFSSVDTSNTHNDGFLSFIGAARVDLKRWKQASTAYPARWYVMQSDRSAKRDAWSSENEFEEREERLLPGAVYFQATLVDFSLAKTEKKTNEATLEGIAEPPPRSSPSSSANNEFQFVLPSQIVTRNRRFLATRVGEIIHEGNTECLQELLPVVLYGKTQLLRAPAGLSVSRQQAQECCCLNKGLQMLQLSCQYACYCTNKLEGNARSERLSSWNLPIAIALKKSNPCGVCGPHAATRKIETKHAKFTQQKAKLQRQREKMELRRRNLRRELQVLDSSLDGMRLLLQQVDPNCLELLQQDL